MRPYKILLATGLALLLAACSNSVATRNAPLDTISAPLDAASSIMAGVAMAKGLPMTDGQSPVSVRAVNVTVPKTLKVSEANRYFPRGDIVWHGEPQGDRHEQVQRIVSDAVNRGVSGLDGPVEIVLNIEVVKFHALSQKARYSVGGVHNLVFMISATDAESGEVLAAPRLWKCDLKAFGGQAAIEAEAKGQNQKVRISDHLAAGIREELTLLNGHENARLGLLQLMHRS